MHLWDSSVGPDPLLCQPLAVLSREVVVADQAPFQEGNFGGPLAKFERRCCDGATECGAQLAKVGVVWGSA